VISSDPSDLETLARSLRLLHSYVDKGPKSLPAQVLRGVDPPMGRALGRRQEAILALPDMATDAGLRPAVIAALIDYSVSNTYNLLRSLSRVGMTELVPGSHPQQWRLTSQHRRSAAEFSRLAGSVRAGEWTTCADISIASRGDTSAAWMVCWAAERLPEFPRAERILLEGGRLHPSDHDHDRIAPEQVRAVLEREGVPFDAQGCADRTCRVTWDELRGRART
jgi:hypothetical protein